MENLYLKLDYCYGIKEFEHTFNFLPNGIYKNNVHIIYAQNGLMKSSFTSSLSCLAAYQRPEQRVTGDPEAILKIDGEIFGASSNLKIYTIKSEFSSSVSEKISSLLVNTALKQQYETAINTIETSGAIILTELAEKIGTRGANDVVSKMLQDLGLSKKFDLFKWFFENQTATLAINSNYGELDYKIISDPKVKAFLGKTDIQTLLSEYKESYDDYLSRTKYLSREFDPSKVAVLSKTFDESGFFQASHKILLQNHINTEENPLTITTSLAFKNIIDDERTEIFNQPDLKKKFEEITKQLSANESLVKFKQYLINNEHILGLLSDCNGDYSLFVKNCWFGYLKEIPEYIEFAHIYRDAEGIIRNIIETANAQNSLWKKIVDEFNARFLPPFELRIENERDAVVGINKPVINFYYLENGQPFRKDVGDIWTILSTGEKRIFFILNLLFDIHSLKQEGGDILLVLDDIADSFDYRNKYGIIEFLRELSEEDNIFMLILTHNFDFYRTIQSRLNCCRNEANNCCWMAYKTENEGIGIIKTDYLDPFKKFRQELHNNPAIFIATIPFARNLIQFSQGYNDSLGYYAKLTSVLHIKNDSMTITLQDIKNIFDSTLNQNNQLNPSFIASDKAIDLIIKTASALSLAHGSGLNLENKIVLSIAIRLLSEEYMINKIQLIETGLNTDNIQGVQTFELFKKFNYHYGSNIEYKTKINTLKNVLLTTPEVIHLNNFMYEPLIDMSDSELSHLFTQIGAIVREEQTNLSILL